MKRFAAFSLLFVALRAHADFTLVENFDEAGHVQKVTIFVKGEKVRVENADTGRVYIEDFAERRCFVMSITKKTYYSGPRVGTPVIREDTNPNIVDTGRQEKIADYKADIYTIDDQGCVNVLWATKDAPDYATVTKKLKQLELNGISTNLMPIFWKLDALPVKLQLFFNGKATCTTTLISLKQEPVDDSEFQPPSDYTSTGPPYR